MSKNKRDKNLHGESGPIPFPANEAADPAYIWLFLGLFLLVPTVPWPFVHMRTRLFSTFEIFRPAEVLVFWVLTLFGVLFCLNAVERWLRHLRVQPLDLSIVVLFVYGAVSGLWAVYPTGFKSAFFSSLVFLIFYILSKFAVTQRGVLEQVVACLHLSILVNNVYALGQLFHCGFFLFGQGEEPIGLLGNRNDLACFLALTLPIGLFRAWTSSPLLQRLGRVNFYVSFVVLLFTRCRSGIISGIVTLLVFHLLKREQDLGVFGRIRKPFPKSVNRVIRVTAVGTIAYLLAMGYCFPEKSKTVSSRVFMYGLIAKGGLETPWLGHGLGTFSGAFQLSQAAHFKGLLNDRARLESGEWGLARFFRQAHNEYLQIFFELGAVGLVLFLWTLFVALKEFGSAYLAHGNLERIRWYPLFGSIFVGGLIQALAGFPFQVCPVALMIAFSLAVVSALSLEEKAGVSLDRRTSSGERDLSIGMRRVVKLAPFIVVIPGLLWVSVTDWLAQVHYHEGLKEENLSLAKDILERARQYDPDDGRIWNELGRTFFLSSDLDKAEQCFEKAFILRADSNVLVNIGCVKAMRGQFDLALSFFTKATEMLPSSPENHFRIGEAKAALKDWPGAVDALKRAIAISVREFKATWTLGRILVDMGHVDQARQQFEENIAFLKVLIAEEDPSGRTIGMEKRRYLTQNLFSLAALFDRAGLPMLASRCYEDLKRYNPQVLRTVGTSSGKSKPVPSQGPNGTVQR